MNIKSHGKANSEQIERLEETIGFALPNDYKCNFNNIGRINT